MDRPTIRRGSKGEHVAAWQMVIGAPPDGVFGPMTEKTTREWQGDNSLPITGVVDDDDWAKAAEKAPIPSPPSALEGQTYLIDKITDATPREAVNALAVAMSTITGNKPTVNGLCCHVAQAALETGHWDYCHHWNFGNVKASTKYRGFITYFGCNEILKNSAGKRQTYWFHPSVDPAWPPLASWMQKHPNSKPSNNQCRWRAFQTIEEGSVEQLAFLAKRGRYLKAWDAGLSGDPAAFAHALRDAGYYTASEKHYTKLLSSLFHKYHGLCEEAVLSLTVKPAVVEVQEPEPEHDDRKAGVLNDDFVKLIPMEVPWDELRKIRNQAVLAMWDD